jgi:hypothetical protein
VRVELNGELFASFTVAPPPSPIDGPSAQALARDELAKREYHRDDESFAARIANWVIDRLDDLTHHVGSTSGFVTLLVVIALLLGLALLIWRAGPLRRSSGPMRARGDLLRPDIGTDHRLLAERFSRDGEWALAVREWLRAAVETIETRGVLDPRPGRTGAEVAREAGALMPSAETALSTASRAFDEIWFAGRAATEADAAAARSAADAVRVARIAARQS